jgi:pimeloyl-ACP methyl ester carboxylesterase
MRESVVVEISRRDAIVGLAALTLATRGKASAIADEGFMRIGGIDQWVSVRGASPDAPLMLYLHGGPGEAMSPFQDLFTPYEQDFLVALWDQRGAGKTYGRSGRDATPGMDPDQFVRDGIELAQILRRRWKKHKIVLVGQSWGAALALRMAKQRPDLFYVSVGTGQPVNLEPTELAQERHARQVLTTKGDQAGLKMLEQAVALPLKDPKRRFATRKFDLGPQDQKFLDRERAFVGTEDAPKTGNVADWAGGFMFTSAALVPKLIAGPELIDEVGYSFRLPIVVIQGRDDYICPTELARDYVARMHAHGKAFVEIEGGHFACLTNPTAFRAALRRHVLPRIREA